MHASFQILLRRVSLIVTLACSSAYAQQLLGTVTVGGPFASGVAVNPVTNKIYVNITDNDLVTVIDGSTWSTTNVAVGLNPAAIGVDSATNKIYSSSGAEGTVTVIDGQTLSTTSVNAGQYPDYMVVDATRNKIYVSTEYTVTVIDGATNKTATIPLQATGLSIDMNTVTNKIYVVVGNGTILAIDGATLATTTVPVVAAILAVNSTTNKIYAFPYNSNTMTVIDGATLSTTTITVGQNPVAIGINSVTNKVYVANFNDNTVTVVDGSTLSTVTVPVGLGPGAVAVDPVTNKIYVANVSDNSVTMIDGATNSTVSLQVGYYPTSIGVNSTTNTIYASSLGDGTVTVIAGAPTNTPPLQLVPVAPCRLVDTRQTGVPIQGGTSQNYTVPELGCGIPASTVAYSLNVTVVPHGSLGYLTIWPTGQVQPYVSTMNSPDGRVKANAAIVSAGYEDAVSVYATDTTDVILDIDGYFTAPSSQTYQFYSVAPCRVVDTRSGSGFPPALGPPALVAKQQRELPILSSSCLQGITNPLAYSFNVTVVPSPAGQPLGYLTVWPSNQTQPVVSTLNNPTATVVANAAIVPADPDNGDIDVYAYNSTDLILDINGYFAAPGQKGLSLYTVAPCRVLDTRSNDGQPFMDEKTVNVVGSPCAPPASAQAYVFNATVVPPGKMPYLTLWADGQQQPVVSTLNAYDGFVTSNMAIVPTTNGSIDAYAAGLTQLILDISGYFAP